MTKVQQEKAAFDLAMGFFNDKAKTEEWLDTPNPQLGYLVPNDMIGMGRGEKLLRVMKAMIEGDMP